MIAPQNKKKKTSIQPVAKLAKWLELEDPHVPKAWKEIGQEVYSRKTLLIAAAESLKDEAEKNGWDISNYWSLAAADVFVEKAQGRLTTRARWFMFMGGVSSAVALGGAIAAICYSYDSDLKALFGNLEINPWTSTLVALKVTAMAGFTGGILYFFTSLSKAMYHEGTALLRTRHALRFGRLYVYLKNGKVDFKELESAFAWNTEFVTAFKDLKISNLATPFERVTELLKEALKNFRSKGKAEKENKYEG